MASKLQKYLTSTPNFDRYFFRSTPGIYKQLGIQKTGILEASEADIDEPQYAVNELIQAGILVRITVTISFSGRKSSNQILISRYKLNQLDDLIGSQITINGRTGTILSAARRRKVISRG